MARIERHVSDSCASTDARRQEAGIGRPAGLLITAATAALVFVIARMLLPLPQGAHRSGPMPSESRAPVVLPSPVDAIDGAGLDGARPALDASSEASMAAEDPKEASTAKASGSLDDRNVPAPADKDIARAAWRANWPDLRSVGQRASLIIPLKGSADGATYRFVPRTGVISVTLPRAAALTTMRYYRLDQEGFKALWTFQDENNANPANGTKFRIKLAISSAPQVEFFDDYVKITIRKPD